MAAELAPPSRWGTPLSDRFLRLDMALGVRLHLDLEQQPEEDRWWLNKCLGEDAILTTSCKQNNFFVTNEVANVLRFSQTLLRSDDQ